MNLHEHWLILILCLTLQVPPAFPYIYRYIRFSRTIINIIIIIHTLKIILNPIPAVFHNIPGNYENGFDVRIEEKSKQF